MKLLFTLLAHLPDCVIRTVDRLLGVGPWRERWVVEDDEDES